MANYLRYIATREGVELLPGSVKSRGATQAQRLYIEEHKNAMERLHEYKYYLSCPTIENASLAITAFAKAEYGAEQEYEQLARGPAAKVSEEGRSKPATRKQKEWIEAHAGGLRDLFEYEDYIKNPTVGSASELITAIAEYNTTDPEIYLKYIAERPGVAKGNGEAHGLWNMAGKADLDAELDKITNTESVAWVHIISLRRDDARRLNYETADAWRKVVASNAGRIAKLYNIDMKNLNILGAFHNEGAHPHIHLFIYSDEKSEGVIPKKQMITAGERMRSIFTGSIFSEDMQPVISRRNVLRSEMNERMKAVSSFYRKEYKPNPCIVSALTSLSEVLPDNGKLQYAYLKPEVKEKVNDTLRTVICADKTLQALTDEYFGLQHSLIERYNDDPEKIEEKYIDFVVHFYEPRTGKYAEKRDITALHNTIIRCAADAEKVQEPDALPAGTPAKKSGAEKSEALPVYGGNTQASPPSPGIDDYKIKSAAVLSARLIASELASLCEIVEAFVRPPQKSVKTRQRDRSRTRKKDHTMREDIYR